MVIITSLGSCNLWGTIINTIPAQWEVAKFLSVSRKAANQSFPLTELGVSNQAAPRADGGGNQPPINGQYN